MSVSPLKFIVAVAAITLGLAAHAQPKIAGKILNAQTGYGIVGIDLDVFDAHGHSVAITGDVSGVDGLYTLSLPAGGSYFVRADPSLSDFFIDQYYTNAFLRAEAKLITVPASGTVSNIDFRLQTGWQIKGFVRSQGVALADIDLDLYAWNGEFLSGYPGKTAADGSFTIGVLPPGTYFLYAQPSVALGQFFVAAFYGGALEKSTASPLVISNSDLSGVVIDLAPGGAIRGHIKDLNTGAGLVGVDLDLYDGNGVWVPFNGASDTNGDYVLGPVPAGQYTLRADPTIQQGYARTYYPNTFFSSAAQAITVQAGKETPGVDFALARAGAVSGRIVDAGTMLPVSGIYVDVYDAATNRLDVFTRSDASGDYLLGPLPAGAFFIQAHPHKTQGYLPQYFNSADSVGGATLVTVTPGNTTSSVNFALKGAGWVQGVVRNAAGLPLSDIDLDIYVAATGQHLRVGDLTRSDGTYEIGPLPPDTYNVRCDPTISQGYAVEYYDSKISRLLADPISVTAGTGTSNINFTLDPGGSISGRVVSAETGQPVSGIDIDVFQAGTLVFMAQNATTGVLGDFTVGPLPAGSYIVRADPAIGSTYLQTYHPSTSEIGAAQPIAVVNSGAVTNVEIRILSMVAPRILVGPQSQTVAPGSNVTFSVTAEGTAPLSYQWFFGTERMLNAIGSMLVLDNVQPANAGSYSVVVSNQVGFQASAVATLNIVVPPQIKTQPASVSVAVGQAAAFTVIAEGTPPLSYQWFKDDLTLVNGKDSTLSIPSVKPEDAGVYTVTVTNLMGQATSAPAALILEHAAVPPRLTVSQPTPRSLRISLEGTAGGAFRLESRQSLTAGQWIPYGGVVTNNTLTVSWEVPVENNFRFFRVQTY